MAAHVHDVADLGDGLTVAAAPVLDEPSLEGEIAAAVHVDVVLAAGRPHLTGAHLQHGLLVSVERGPPAAGPRGGGAEEVGNARRDRPVGGVDRRELAMVRAVDVLELSGDVHHRSGGVEAVDLAIGQRAEHGVGATVRKSDAGQATRRTNEPVGPGDPGEVAADVHPAALDVDGPHERSRRGPGESEGRGPARYDLTAGGVEQRHRGGVGRAVHVRELPGHEQLPGRRDCEVPHRAVEGGTERVDPRAGGAVERGEVRLGLERCARAALHVGELAADVDPVAHLGEREHHRVDLGLGVARLQHAHHAALQRAVDVGDRAGQRRRDRGRRHPLIGDRRARVGQRGADPHLGERDRVLLAAGLPQVAARVVAPASDTLPVGPPGERGVAAPHPREDPIGAVA